MRCNILKFIAAWREPCKPARTTSRATTDKSRRTGWCFASRAQTVHKSNKQDWKGRKHFTRRRFCARTRARIKHLYATMFARSLFRVPTRMAVSTMKRAKQKHTLSQMVIPSNKASSLSKNVFGRTVACHVLCFFPHSICYWCTSSDLTIQNDT